MNISTNIDIQLLFDSHMYLMNISYQYRYTTTIWQPHILNSDTNGVPTHAPQHHNLPRHANSWLTAKKANTCARTGKLHGLCERLTSLGLIWAPLNPSIPQCRDAREISKELLTGPLLCRETLVPRTAVRLMLHALRAISGRCYANDAETIQEIFRAYLGIQYRRYIGHIVGYNTEDI